VRRLEQEAAQLEQKRAQKAQQGYAVQTSSLEVLAAELNTDDYIELGMVRLEASLQDLRRGSPDQKQN